jgi:hypothetical protein
MITYDGEAAAPWDASNIMHKFHITVVDSDIEEGTITAWYDKSTHNVSWIKYEATDPTVPNIIVRIRKIEETTFEDSYLTIKGCYDGYLDNPALKVKLWWY